MTTQYEYRKNKEAQKRVDEATAGGVGYTTLKGGSAKFPIKEVMRVPGQPLALPFDEQTPMAANPQLYGPDGVPTRKITVAVQSGTEVDENVDAHYGLTPTPEQENTDD